MTTYIITQSNKYLFHVHSLNIRIFGSLEFNNGNKIQQNFNKQTYTPKILSLRSPIGCLEHDTYIGWLLQSLHDKKIALEHTMRQYLGINAKHELKEARIIYKRLCEWEKYFWGQTFICIILQLQNYEIVSIFIKCHEQ